MNNCNCCNGWMIHPDYVNKPYWSVSVPYVNMNDYYNTTTGNSTTFHLLPRVTCENTEKTKASR